MQLYLPLDLAIHGQRKLHCAMRLVLYVEGLPRFREGASVVAATAAFPGAVAATAAAYFPVWGVPAPQVWALTLCAGAVVGEGRGAPVYAPAPSDQLPTAKHMVFGRVPILTLF